ncbi:hypothetical protein EYF80_045806 [Liparis tanakae]|uniref:Uncharacterized protein n=1 Tax=Liparis tanakae TaxID=230148 RepID=A0A4Z2FS69_9TELE|nr:hypothetical protein EYF80_045806 [Liparis tanakae]
MEVLSGRSGLFTEYRNSSGTGVQACVPGLQVGYLTEQPLLGGVIWRSPARRYGNRTGWRKKIGLLDNTPTMK